MACRGRKDLMILEGQKLALPSTKSTGKVAPASVSPSLNAGFLGLLAAAQPLPSAIHVLVSRFNT